VGNYGRGTLTISNGGLVTSNGAFLGEFAGSTGSVTVSGVGSRWDDPVNMVVGDSGQGTLTITNGGVVTSNEGADVGEFSASSIGNVTVSGAGSQWNASSGLGLAIGTADQATVTIQSGGTANASGVDTGLGKAALTLQEAGVLNTQEIILLSGRSTLNVQSGGVVNGTVGQVGAFQGTASAAATVTGAGSRWNLSGGLGIGARKRIGRLGASRTPPARRGIGLGAEELSAL
jgi:T5SS/PEP-CTERM-associated repeat protein